MNEELYSNNSELLHAYLDGELTSTEEHVLFSELAESESLRSEMRDLMAIRNAIHGDKDAFVPPLAATTAIFAGLGFAAPSTASATMAAPAPIPVPAPDPATSSAMASFFGTVARPLVKPFIGAVAGSALTATVVTTVMNDGQPVQDARPVEMQPPAVQLVQEVPPTPMLSDLWIDVSQKPADAGTAANAAVVDTDADKFDRITIQYNDPQQTQKITAADLQGKTREIENVLRTHFDLDAPSRDRIMVQLMNTPVIFSSPSSNLSSEADPYLMNMRGGVFYIVDDNHLFGVEAGREQFAQLYNQPLDYGRTALYEQNPTAWWITAAYRYKTGELVEIPGLHGFFQANLGGALQLGPLGRGVAGLQYDIAPGFLFQVGVEGSMMIYKLDTNYFTTRKVGLIYGLSMQF